jgi:hypothetical protein
MTKEIVDIVKTVITATGAILSAWCVAKVAQVHNLVNSRMTELLEITRSSARSAGELEGRDYAQKEKDRHDHEPAA